MRIHLSPCEKLAGYFFTKTGSTTFKTYFDKVGWKRVDAEKVDCPIFTFIRNPEDRLRSAVNEMIRTVHLRPKTILRLSDERYVLMDEHFNPYAFQFERYMHHTFIPIPFGKYHHRITKMMFDHFGISGIDTEAAEVLNKTKTEELTDVNLRIIDSYSKKLLVNYDVDIRIFDAVQQSIKTYVLDNPDDYPYLQRFDAIYDIGSINTAMHRVLTDRNGYRMMELLGR